MSSSSSEVVIIDGKTLNVEKLVQVSRFDAKVELSDEAREIMGVSRCVVDGYVYGASDSLERATKYGVKSEKYLSEVRRNAAILGNDGQRVSYGITTGFGELARVRVPVADVEQLQYNLIRSHSVGTGPLLSREAVRASMLIRANTLATGISGVRPCIVDQIVAFLNAGITPRIPCQGSVGSSGDLAPTAHMALALIGEGLVEFGGEEMPSLKAMEHCNIAPLKLEAKEGLSLINGTQVMTGVGALAIYDAENLYKASIVSATMSIEALSGTDKALDPRIHTARPHPGQIRAANGMRKCVEGSAIVAAYAKVQDAYSLRCAPQVVGPAADAIAMARRTADIEMNSATDNPLVFADTAEVRSNGNFHGEPMAMAMDFLKIAVAEIANVAERRTARMVDPSLSGLPAFLVENSGLNSGFMMAQYTSAALVSENKVLAHPACVDSIPTSANQEDHVSMGTIAARQCAEIVRNATAVIGIELLIGAQGIDFHKEAPGKGTAVAHDVIRKHVSHLDKDRVLATDIEELRKLVHSGEIVKAVEAAVGEL